VDLRWTPAEEAFRARAWLESNVPRDLPLGTTRDGFAACVEWEKKLYDARWGVVAWPQRYGGRDATLWEWLIFEEEYYRAGGPHRVTQNGIFLLAPTLFEFGTPQQQDRYLPRMPPGSPCTWWTSGAPPRPARCPPGPT
jgi:alkylation response protein AidB-like acyl-CoA dehydrogenase